MITIEKSSRIWSRNLSISNFVRLWKRTEESSMHHIHNVFLPDQSRNVFSQTAITLLGQMTKHECNSPRLYKHWRNTQICTVLPRPISSAKRAPPYGLWCIFHNHWIPSYWWGYLGNDDTRISKIQSFFHILGYFNVFTILVFTFRWFHTGFNRITIYFSNDIHHFNHLLLHIPVALCDTTNQNRKR